MKRSHILKIREMMYKAAISLNDDDAMDAVELFPLWQNGVAYAVGDRCRDNGYLFKCRQSHVSQTDWKPSVTPALWEEVARPGDGTHDNPIRYNNNMSLENGKYYTQYNVLYLCIRNTGVAVYNNLADLVGLYVEITE